MELIPLDVLKLYLVGHLDPRDLIRLSAICKRFAIFRFFVHEDYLCGDYDKALTQACWKGHRALAEWLINVKGATKLSWPVRRACEAGYWDLAEWLIKVKGANCNDALYGASIGGHHTIVRSLVPISTDYESAFIFACYGGHLGLAKWLADRVVMHKNRGGPWQESLRIACSEGFQDIAEWLIDEKMPEVQDWRRQQDGYHHIPAYPDFDEAVGNACLGGRETIVKWLMLEKGAPTNGYFGLACKGGNRSLAEWLLDEYSATEDEINRGAIMARRAGHQSLAEWLIEDKGAVVDDTFFISFSI